MRFPHDITTPAFYEVFADRDAKWRAVVEHILQREGFGTPELRLLSGSNLSYCVDERLVFKAFLPDVPHEGIIERDLLAACTTDDLAATPELLATGEDGWLWVIMTKLPGQELRPIHDLLSPRDHQRVSEQLADWAAAFQESSAVQTLELHLPQPWQTLQSELRDGLGAKLQGRGLTEPWLAQLPDFYSDWEPIHDTSVVHADLHDMNILVSEGPKGWELTGVFDFADAMRAPRIYELGAPLMFVARGVRGEVEAMCERVLGRVPEPRELLQWTLLHRFADLQYYLDNFDYIPGDATSLDDVARAMAGVA
jgi:hygromycin-B 7''-O-kinase